MEKSKIINIIGKSIRLAHDENSILKSINLLATYTLQFGYDEWSDIQKEELWSRLEVIIGNRRYIRRKTQNQTKKIIL